MPAKIGREICEPDAVGLTNLSCRQWLAFADFGLHKTRRGLRQHGIADRQPEQDERRRNRAAIHQASLELARDLLRAQPVAGHQITIGQLAQCARVVRVERQHSLVAGSRLIKALERQQDGAARIKSIKISRLDCERPVVGRKGLRAPPQERQRIAAVEMHFGKVRLLSAIARS